MAKGKKSSGNKYISAGLHNNVNRKTKNAIRSDYLISGDRLLNQLKAFRAKKRVVVTIENPNKEETNKRFIRVTGDQFFKPDYTYQM